MNALYYFCIFSPEMLVKWKGRILKYGKKKLGFDEDIIIAGMFKEWVVACTSARVHFYGDEHMTLSRPIRNAVISENGIYYHHLENNHIFLISHPLKREEFVFFCYGFLLKGFIYGALVLEGHGGYLLKNVGLGDTISYSEQSSPDIDMDENMVGRDFDEINKVKMLCIFEGGEHGIWCVVDDSEDLYKNKSENGITIDIFEHKNFLVGTHKRTALFIRFERHLKDVKLFSEKYVVFDRDIDCVMKYRMEISKDSHIELLRINEMVFFGGEPVCDFTNVPHWGVRKQPRGWKQNYYRPFFCEIGETEKDVLGYCSEPVQRDFIEMLLRHKEKRFDLLVSGCAPEKIDEIAKKWLVKCDNIHKFLDLDFFSMENIDVVLRCKRLISLTRSPQKEVGDVLDIKYKRILKCDGLNFLKGAKYSGIRNLAYKIIYLEQQKDRMFSMARSVTSTRRMLKTAEKYFKDTRLEEIFSLFDEEPLVFEIDDHDFENKKEKGYILRIVSNIGRAYFFHGSGIIKRKHVSVPLRFSIHKNNELCEIEIKEQGWADWPAFNYAVSRGCSINPRSETQHAFVEARIDEFVSRGGCSEFALGGEIFALGLQGKLMGIHPQTVVRLISHKFPVMSMALLAGIGASYIGRKDDSFGKLCMYYLKSSQPIYIHVGATLCLGLLYSGSGNTLVGNVLVSETNERGIFRCETYNRGNKIWYDHMYRISAAFSTAMLHVGVDPEAFRFIELQDPLCELLVNGIALFGSSKKRYAKRFIKGDTSKPEVLFYSEFFLLGLSLDKNLAEIVSEAQKRYGNAEICELYRISGRILYVAVYILYKDLPSDSNESLFKTLMEILLSSEKLMQENQEFKILFDTCLVALSLISNPFCNLDVIRVLRRRIKMTERSKFLQSQTDFFFTTSKCKQETQFTIRYGDIERYKLCLGVAACGFGSLKILSTPHLILNVLATFFVSFPVATSDQEYFNMFRYLLLLSVGRTEDGFRSGVSYLKMCCKGSKNRMLSDLFNIDAVFSEEFSKASDADKKLTIDILTDFYEQHGGKSSLLNVETLKILSCKFV